MLLYRGGKAPQRDKGRVSYFFLGGREARGFRVEMKSFQDGPVEERPFTAEGGAWAGVGDEVGEMMPGLLWYIWKFGLPAAGKRELSWGIT